MVTKNTNDEDMINPGLKIGIVILKVDMRLLYPNVFPASSKLGFICNNLDLIGPNATGKQRIKHPVININVD